MFMTPRPQRWWLVMGWMADSPNMATAIQWCSRTMAIFTARLDSEEVFTMVPCLASSAAWIRAWTSWGYFSITPTFSAAPNTARLTFS